MLVLIKKILRDLKEKKATTIYYLKKKPVIILVICKSTSTTVNNNYPEKAKLNNRCSSYFSNRIDCFACLNFPTVPPRFFGDTLFVWIKTIKQ